MSLPIRDAVQSAGRYLFRNPSTVVRMLGQAAGFNIAVPLDALRWLTTHLLTGKKAPQDVIITARPPALAVGATVEYMGQKIRVSASVRIDKLDAAPGHLQVTLRAQNLDVKFFDPKHPMNQMIQSGALDLSKPANLLNMMGGKKPPVIVSAKDDEFVLDLMQIPAVTSNPQVGMALDSLTPVVRIEDIRTEGDMLIIDLKPTPGGLRQTIASFRR